MERLSTVLPKCFSLLSAGLVLAACGHSRGGPSDFEIRALYSFGTHGQSYYLLLPGNRIFAAIPNGGLESFDFDKAKAEQPQNCGTYTLDGDRMKITWGGGRAPETWKHTARGSDEQMDGAAWMKGLPCKDGQRLDGHYTQSSGTANVRVFREITFLPDGTYRRSAVGATRTDAAGGIAQRDEEGTYELSGYTLTLKARDGKTTRCTFFVEVKGKDDARPEIVVCDGDKLGRARS